MSALLSSQSGAGATKPKFRVHNEVVRWNMLRVVLLRMQETVDLDKNGIGHVFGLTATIVNAIQVPRM
jgi:hypothetical protein